MTSDYIKVSFAPTIEGIEETIRSLKNFLILSSDEQEEDEIIEMIIHLKLVLRDIKEIKMP